MIILSVLRAERKIVGIVFSSFRANYAMKKQMMCQAGETQSVGPSSLSGAVDSGEAAARLCIEYFYGS